MVTESDKYTFSEDYILQGLRKLMVSVLDCLNQGASRMWSIILDLRDAGGEEPILMSITDLLVK